MRRALVLALLLSTGLLLAGCTSEDDPGSTGDPEESTEAPNETPFDMIPYGPMPPTGEPARVTPTSPPAAEPTPAAPVPPPPPATDPAPTPPPAPPSAAPLPTSPPVPAPAPTTPAPPPPTPAPTSPPTVWPREGSTVRYEVVVLAGAPDGSVNSDWFTNWTWTHGNGDWVGLCDGTHVHGPTDEPQARDPISATFTAATPPHWPPMMTRSPPEAGETLTAGDLFRCEIQDRDAKYAGLRDGQHAATDFDDGSPDDYEVRWDKDTGLVLEWDQWRRYSHAWGMMTART